MAFRLCNTSPWAGQLSCLYHCGLSGRIYKKYDFGFQWLGSGEHCGHASILVLWVLCFLSCFFNYFMYIISLYMACELHWVQICKTGGGREIQNTETLFKLLHHERRLLWHPVWMWYSGSEAAQRSNPLMKRGSLGTYCNRAEASKDCSGSCQIPSMTQDVYC